MHRSRTKRILYFSLALFAVALLTILVSTFIADRYIGVSIELNTSNAGPVRVSLVPVGEKLNEDNSTTFRATPKRKTYYRWLNDDDRVFSLVIKPGSEIDNLQLYRLSVHRLGRATEIFDSATLGKRLIPSHSDGRVEKLDGYVQLSQEDRRQTFLMPGVSVGKKNLRTTKLLLVGVVVLTLMSAVVWIVSLSFGTVGRVWLGMLVLLAWIPMLSVALPMWALVLVRAGSIVFAVVWFARLVYSQASIRCVAPGLLAIVFLVFIGFGANRVAYTVSGFDTREFLNPAAFRSTRMQFETFVRENFPSRADFIEFVAESKIFGLGISPTPKMMLGEEGFMFEGRGERRVEGDTSRVFDNVSDLLGRLQFTDKELAIWASVLTERRDWLRARNIPYLFVLAPTKDMIYGEHLPVRLRQHQGKQRRYDQLLDYLKSNTDVPVLDLRPALLETKTKIEYPQLYYKTDFHWNFYGSFVAYQEIVEQLNRNYPSLGLEPLQLADFDIQIDTDWVHGPYMHSLGLDPNKHANEHYVRFVPKAMDRFPKSGVISNQGIQDAQWPIETIGSANKSTKVKMIKNEAGQHPSMLVLGDSFIEKSLLYLSVHAKRLMYQRAVVGFPMQVFESGERPTVVVQEVLNMYVLGEPPNNRLLRKSDALPSVKSNN